MTVLDYSSLLLEERFSLTATNKLRKKYPYAASLLIYTVLERCLKIYLIGNRNNKSFQKKLNLNTDIKSKKNLGYFINQNVDDDKFVEEVLKHCTLGKLEMIYKICDKPFSKNRNDIMHSNLYLHEQKSNSYKERGRKNKQYLNQAIKDLIKASGYFKKEIITDENGDLKFK